MKKMGVVVGVALAVTLLSGCAASGGAGAEVPSGTPKATETTAPLVAEEPADSSAAEFDTAIRRVPGLENVDAEQALQIGLDTCDKLNAGTPADQIIAVEGSDPAVNAEAIIVAALVYCSDHVAAAETAYYAITQPG